MSSDPQHPSRSWDRSREEGCTSAIPVLGWKTQVDCKDSRASQSSSREGPGRKQNIKEDTGCQPLAFSSPAHRQLCPVCMCICTHTSTCTHTAKNVKIFGCDSHLQLSSLTISQQHISQLQGMQGQETTSRPGACSQESQAQQECGRCLSSPKTQDKEKVTEEKNPSKKTFRGCGDSAQWRVFA